MWTIKNRPAMFSNINTKWSGWCITPSLSYKNTMSNRITMETVACLWSKCHLKQNLIPSWPWSFRHTSCISDFRCKTKYTKNFVGFSARSVRRISKNLLLSSGSVKFFVRVHFSKTIKGIHLKLGILVHYQKRNQLQQGRWPCDLYIQRYLPLFRHRT